VQNKINHIAIIRLSAMGDVALTVPVIRAFISQYPTVKVTVVSRPIYKPFFDTIPEVGFLAIDLDKTHKGFFGLFRLFQELKESGVDALADLHNVIRTKVLTFFFKLYNLKVATVDKGRAEKTALTRAKNKIFRPLPSMMLQHAQVFRQLGFPVNLQNPNFPNLTAFTGEKTQKWIGIAPFAQYESKVYPLDLMQKVIDDLSQNTNYKLFLFGAGTKEISLLTKMTDGKTNVVNMAGKVKLAEELKIISHLDVMLSMDSANAHIAAMLGTNAVTLWGATHPYAGFTPFNQPLENCLISDRGEYPLLPTSVYGNKIVEGYQDAMRTITPEMVVERLNSLM
jgi:ADP-heptose:LPS heptosyltransferase